MLVLKPLQERLSFGKQNSIWIRILPTMNNSYFMFAKAKFDPNKIISGGYVKKV